jgi:hypothetical protein
MDGSCARPRLLPIALTLSLAGCDARLYRPAVPRTNDADGLRVEIVSIRTIPPLTVELRVDGAEGTKMRHALLAPAKAEVCHEGVRPSGIVVDGKQPWLRPIEIEGKHDVRLTFPAGASNDLLAEPTVIDIVFASNDGERCVRMALTGPDELRFTTTFRGYASSGLRVEIPAKSVGGVGAGWTHALGFGGYAGPLRLGADVGIGTAACTHDCAGSTIGFLWLPTAVTASAFVIDRGDFALQLGAGYRLYFADVGSGDRSRSLTIHAPEARITLGSTLWQGPGLPSGARVAAGGLDLFFSNWRWSGPAGAESSFVFGLGLSGQAGW